MAAAAEAGIGFTVVDAETLSLIGFAGNETHAELLHSNFFLLLSLVNQMLFTEIVHESPFLFLFRTSRYNNTSGRVYV